jgi:hypothetical protein
LIEFYPIEIRRATTANEFMQTLGRIHRSGQVANPEFILLQTALPAEKRPAAILGKKMSMLNANTTSNAKTDVSEGNAAIDIFNQYGDEMAYKVLERDKDLQEQLRPLGSSLAKFFDEKTGALIPYQDAQKEVNEQPDGYIARTITGYLAILPVEEQEIFWEKTLADYNAYISYLDQIGQNALEAKALDLQAKTLSSEVFTEKAEGDSAFSAPSYIETVETKVGKKPLTGEKAVEMSEKRKAGSRQILQAYISSADAAANEQADKKAKRALKPWDSEKRSEFLSNQRAQRNVIASAISLIGRFGSVNRNDGNAGLGVIEEIKLDQANPLTPSKQIAIIRVNDSRETLKVPVTQLAEAFTPAPNESAKEWDDSTDIGGESAIATGNLMAAMKELGGAGKVITYTTDAGADQMGILLPKSFMAKRGAVKARVTINSVDKLLSALDAGIPVTNSDGSIKFTKGASIVTLSVPASRSGGGNIWRNPNLNRMALGGEFTQVGSEMRATYGIGNLQLVFQIVTEMGETFSSAKPNDFAVSDDTAAFGQFIDQQEGRGLRTSDLPTSEKSDIDSPRSLQLPLEPWNEQRESQRPTSGNDQRIAASAIQSFRNALGTASNLRFFTLAERASGQDGIRGDRRRLSDSLVRTIGAFESAFGKRVVFFEADAYETPPPRGGLHPNLTPNYIGINADSPFSLPFVLGHELGHAIQRQQNGLYEEFKAKVLPLFKDRDGYVSREGLGQKYADEKLDNEVFNDTLGHFFRDPDLWNELAAKDAGLTVKIGRFVAIIIDKMLRGLGARVARDASPNVADNLSSIRSHIADLLKQYRETGYFPSFTPTPQGIRSSEGLRSADLPEPETFAKRVPVSKPLTDEARRQQQAFGKNVSTGKLASFGNE